jgi:uncharacterized membrane protein YhfC
MADMVLKKNIKSILHGRWMYNGFVFYEITATCLQLARTIRMLYGIREKLRTT